MKHSAHVFSANVTTLFILIAGMNVRKTDKCVALNLIEYRKRLGRTAYISPIFYPHPHCAEVNLTYPRDINDLGAEQLCTPIHQGRIAVAISVEPHKAKPI